MRLKVLALFGALVLLSGCAMLGKPRYEQMTGQATYDISADMSSSIVIDKAYEAVGTRSESLQKSVGFMPPELPEKPGAPTMSMRSMPVMYTSITVPSVSCEGAYAQLEGDDKSLTSSDRGKYARYKACIYPYEDGYRLYLVGLFQHSTGGSLLSMFSEKMDEELAAKRGAENIYAYHFAGIMEEIEKRFPNSEKTFTQLPE